jgi:lipopolysaccharide/colanic/teichoic acid biosynthesis glycosyltransferase
VVGTAVEFDSLGGITLLGVRQEGLSRSSSLLKRGFDLAVAGAVVTLLAPVLMASAVAIRLGSPGSILFRQRRIGRNGHEFEMLKFRTMVAGAEDQRDGLLELNETEGLFKLSDDPRVTRVGRFLRAMSLDELPQLFNVLRGEMSLVGPRPLVPDEDCKVCGWDRRRLYVLPGMTGHWQIMGGARVPLDEMVKIDYLYGANWSLWDDVKTLLRTVPHVAFRRGL